MDQHWNFKTVFLVQLLSKKNKRHDSTFLLVSMLLVRSSGVAISRSQSGQCSCHLKALCPSNMHINTNTETLKRCTDIQTDRDKKHFSKLNTSPTLNTEVHRLLPWKHTVTERRCHWPITSIAHKHYTASVNALVRATVNSKSCKSRSSFT